MSLQDVICHGSSHHPIPYGSEQLFHLCQASSTHHSLIHSRSYEVHGPLSSIILLVLYISCKSQVLQPTFLNMCSSNVNCPFLILSISFLLVVIFFKHFRGTYCLNSELLASEPFFCSLPISLHLWENCPEFTIIQD